MTSLSGVVVNYNTIFQVVKQDTEFSAMTDGLDLGNGVVATFVTPSMSCSKVRETVQTEPAYGCPGNQCDDE